MLERIIRAFLLKKAVPHLSLRPGKFPEIPELDSVNDESHRNYKKFMDEHRVELNSQEAIALKRYREDSFGVNNYLRYDLTYNDEMEHQINHLDRAISKSIMNRPVTLWRKINFAEGEPVTDKLMTFDLFTNFYNYLGWKRAPTHKELSSLKGFKFKEPGFSSASLSANAWIQGSLTLKINLDRGQSGLVMNSAYEFKPHSQGFEEFGEDHGYSAEHEVLLNANTMFVVDSATYDPYKGLILSVRVLD